MEQMTFEEQLLLAHQGDADAQNNVGCCYMDGTGTKQNNEKAFGWFVKAVDQGHDFALLNLGEMYEKIDIKKSIEYYQLAADKGCDIAVDQLNRLKNN